VQGKKINPESLPRINLSFNETIFKASDEITVLDNSKHFNQLKRTIDMMKVENDKRKLIE